MKKLVSECFAHEKGRFYILLTVQRAIRAEIKMLSTVESILCSQSPDVLKSFDWNMIYEDLHAKAPVLLGFLLSATQTRTPRGNRSAVICVCVAILLKYRFKRLNLVQKVLGLVLYASSCSKKVIILYNLYFMHVHTQHHKRTIVNINLCKRTPLMFHSTVLVTRVRLHLVQYNLYIANMHLETNWSIILH